MSSIDAFGFVCAVQFKVHLQKIHMLFLDLIRTSKLDMILIGFTVI